MRGNTIIVAPNPKGIFVEGTINGALQPGVRVQIDISAGEDSNGRYTWEAYAPGADGEQRLFAVLLRDRGQGKLATDAYTSGDHCYIYIPIAGEELNLYLTDATTGTGDDLAFGAILMSENGTGAVIATSGSPETEVAQLLEDVVDPTADQLVHCIYTGT